MNRDIEKMLRKMRERKDELAHTAMQFSSDNVFDHGKMVGRYMEVCDMELMLEKMTSNTDDE